MLHEDTEVQEGVARGPPFVKNRTARTWMHMCLEIHRRGAGREPDRQGGAWGEGRVFTRSLFIPFDL